MQDLFGILFLISIPTLIVGIIKPSLFGKAHISTRKHAAVLLGGLTLLFFVLIGITAPPEKGVQANVKGVSTSAAPTAAPTIMPSPTPTLFPINTPTPTIYQTQQTQGSSTGLSNDNYYTNSSGNQVHSPAYSTDNSVPAGATALCADGTYSFSQHRSGTCSHHGGVTQWY